MIVLGECRECLRAYVDRGRRPRRKHQEWRREPQTFFCPHWRDADDATAQAAFSEDGRGESGPVRARRAEECELWT